MSAGGNNLLHALTGICHDPDCEIHRIEVGIKEEVVGETEVAFFISGMDRLVEAIEAGTLSPREHRQKIVGDLIMGRYITSG